MGTQAFMLLMLVLFCSAIQVNLANVPTPGKHSMSSDILDTRLKSKANNVIKYIWEKEPSTNCNIEKPSDSKLNEKTFLLFMFIPYLCVILYDASLRYISLSNDSHFDNSIIDPSIAETIVSAFKKENLCQKMKENVWSTTIAENELWVSNFNASMKDNLFCQRYCESGVVNPLCAYALWLDISIKNSSALTSGSPVHEFTTGQLLSAVGDNGNPNTKVEEKYSHSNIRNRLPSSSVKEHGLLTNTSVAQNPVPSTDIANRTRISLENGRSSFQHNSSKKDAQVVTSSHNNLVQSPADGKDPKRFDTLAPHENAGTHPDANSPQNTGFVQTTNSGNLNVNNTNMTTLQHHRVGSSDHTQKMELPNLSIKSPDVGSTVRAGLQSTLGQGLSNEQQVIKPSEEGQIVTSIPPVESGTSVNTEEESKLEKYQGNSQNLLEEEKVISQSPEHLEPSNADSDDKVFDEIPENHGIPENHEEQTATDEGTIGNTGEEEESMGGTNKAPEQAISTEDNGNGDDDKEDGGGAQVKESRFNSESNDPGAKMNSSPKTHDYVLPDDDDDDDDVINGGAEKEQNDAGAGLLVHERFVDAEDSHFFAYFMTMVILCIIGYLIFHNKQKILALALEGRVRKGTRRRPSTSGYRKLDSNLEEAVTSNCAGPSVTHVIY